VFKGERRGKGGRARPCQPHRWLAGLRVRSCARPLAAWPAGAPACAHRGPCGGRAMGKKRKSDDEDAKKKKKEAKKKKKKEAKKKKDKRKKKESKKGKKQDSSSSSSDSSSSADKTAKDAKRRKEDKGGEAGLKGDLGLVSPQHSLEIPPPEEGIRRFEFTAEETGPLGLRFSGGFPPLILAVNAESFAGRKGVPSNFEVHAINGLALVPQNRDVVMNSLKARPVTLDVRPQGWKPKEKVKELERKRQLEEAERNARIQAEEQRREQVAREAAEQAEREAAERAERQELERREREEQAAKAREARMQQRAREEEFERVLASDPQPLRRAAAELMEAEYGSSVRLEDGSRGVPLRLFTRRKEVAWLWAGEVQELIGGGVVDAADTWS